MIGDTQYFTNLTVNLISLMRANTVMWLSFPKKDTSRNAPIIIPEQTKEKKCLIFNLIWRGKFGSHSATA